MILLPRGNPVKENVNPGKINLPEAFAKLHAGRFSGYLRFDFRERTGIVIFQGGRLISALFESSSQRLIAYDAIAMIFQLALEDHGRLDIYRLSPELAFSVHALLHGEVLHQGQYLQLVDIRSLLRQMRDEQRSGCLRIYSQEHVALIFYRDGKPLGFFHDGSTDIETDVDLSLSVAREPGAKVDVLVTRSNVEPSLADLMATANLSDLWMRALENCQRHRWEEERAASRSLAQLEGERRQKTLAMFRNAALQHLGPLGASLVDKEFDRLKLNGAPLNETRLTGFYDNLAARARLVAGSHQIERMLSEMKKSARNLLREI